MMNLLLGSSLLLSQCKNRLHAIPMEVQWTFLEGVGETEFDITRNFRAHTAKESSAGISRRSKHKGLSIPPRLNKCRGLLYNFAEFGFNCMILSRG